MVLVAKTRDHGHDFVAKALVEVGRLEAKGIEEDNMAVSLPTSSLLAEITPLI